MIDFDIEPVEQPDPPRIQDALRKGLGRALLWAKQGKWTDHELLREACFHDFRYDQQTEAPRGGWLWQLMETIGAGDAFREEILSALGRLQDDPATGQLCQFALFYARDGDERFRQELRRIVIEKPVLYHPWLGEEELLALDGAAGFLCAATVRGKALADRAWDWDDTGLIDTAAEQLGEPAVAALLERESASSPEVRCFRDQWRQAVEKENPAPKYNDAERMRRFTLQDVIQTAEVEGNKAGYLRGWGIYAEEKDLQVILGRLFACQEPESLANYLRVFSKRALPRWDERIFGFLDHDNEKVRRWGYAVVAQNTHPAIRRFALEQLQQRSTDENFIKLFIKNWQPGDEYLLLDNFRVPEDPDEWHGLLMNVVSFLKANPAADCQGLALRAYRLTPCGPCRFDAAELLVKRDVAPAWLREECRWDAVADTRELVGAAPEA